MERKPVKDFSTYFVCISGASTLRGEKIYVRAGRNPRNVMDAWNRFFCERV
jgi:hypothetical protein